MGIGVVDGLHLELVEQSLFAALLKGLAVAGPGKRGLRILSARTQGLCCPVELKKTSSRCVARYVEFVRRRIKMWDASEGGVSRSNEGGVRNRKWWVGELGDDESGTSGTIHVIEPHWRASLTQIRSRIEET